MTVVIDRLSTLGPVTATEDAPRPIWTVVVAGGVGTRFGAPKQYETLAGREVLDWSVAAAASVSDGVVVVVPEADVDRRVRGVDRVVGGGRTRSASVRAGLAAVPDDADIVLIHDAARPAASPALFERVIAAVRGGADGVVPGIPVTDSLRTRAGEAVDREQLVAVQTPQGFRAGTIRAAHAGGDDASDDATVVERAGGTIVIVDGEITNTKLTHGHDRVVLERTLAERVGTCAGGDATEERK